MSFLHATPHNLVAARACSVRTQACALGPWWSYLPQAGWSGEWTRLCLDATLLDTHSHALPRIVGMAVPSVQASPQRVHHLMLRSPTLAHTPPLLRWTRRWTRRQTLLLGPSRRWQVW